MGEKNAKENNSSGPNNNEYLKGGTFVQVGQLAPRKSRPSLSAGLNLQVNKS